MSRIRRWTGWGIALLVVAVSVVASCDEGSNGHSHEGHRHEEGGHEHEEGEHGHEESEHEHEESDHDHGHGEGEHGHDQSGAGHEHEETEHAHGSAHGSQESRRVISFSEENQSRFDFGVVEAAERQLQPSVEAWATIRAPEGEHVTIRAPFAGRLSSGEALPKAGDELDAGGRIGRLIPTPGTDQMAAARAHLRQAELEVKRAEQNLQRVKRLYEQGALPERRLVDAKHGLRVAEAGRDAAKNRLEQAEGVETPGAAESAVAIRAPIAGRVVRREAATGTYVEAGAPLVEMVTMTRRWMRFEVPTSEALVPEQISGAWFSIENSGSSGRDAEVFELSVDDPQTSVVAVGPTVTGPTQTIPVIMSAPARPEWHPGMFVRGHLRMGQMRKQVAVPASAIVERKGRPTVFVKVGGEQFVRRSVELGIRDGRWAGVVEGVRPGERVVSEGAYYVKLAGAQTGAVGHHH